MARRGFGAHRCNFLADQHDLSLPPQFQAVLEAAPDAMVITDRGGRIVLLNSQAELLFGYRTAELLGELVEKLIPERFRAGHPGHRNLYFADPRKRAMGAGGLELWGLRKDGTEFPAEISLSPLETAHGVFAITAIRDVSTRRRIESKFKGLLEAAPDAMVITDQRGRIVLVNAQAEQLFGYKREELLGQMVEVLIPKRFRGNHPAHRQAYFREPRTRPMGAAGALELWGLRRDGVEFPVEISLSPLETEEGLLAMTAIRDITDRKRAEEERARLHERTKELEALKTKFFANVSHELRTPLALILGPVEKRLAQADLDPDMRRDLELVHRNARALVRQVNDLLDVAKLEAGKMRPDYVRCDVGRVISQVASNFEGLAGQRGIVLTVTVPAACDGEIDPDKLQRILLNLLSNAFKFTPDGGRIRCSASLVGDRLLSIEVADSGPGIPHEFREAVFDRFQQLEPPHGRHVGTGLGLAIARDLTQLHGGRIAIGEAPEGGALFSVELPLVAPIGTPVGERAPAAALEHHAVRDTLVALDGGGGARVAAAETSRPLVLIIEDNHEMRRFLEETLGVELRVEVASNGQEGLDMARRTRPDLILTDVMMPLMSGEQLIVEARRAHELDDVPIVVLTAKADDDLRIRLLQQGAQDYVMKPFSADELRARVRNLLETKRARDLLQRELEHRVESLDQLAAEVATRKRDLETALLSTQVARDFAERASRFKSDLLGLLSHELRTPLTSLGLQADRLNRQASTLTPKQLDSVAKIRTAVRRLAELVDSVLDYSRIESGRLRLAIGVFDLTELTGDVVDEVRPLAERKGLSLEVSAQDGLPPLSSDRHLVRLVLMNLLSNAIKYTERGSIRVELAHASSRHLISVADTGPGISAEDRVRIFEPFEQLELPRHKHKSGVGLGLAIVREITRSLGGRIDVESELGAGAKFQVELPRLEARPTGQPPSAPSDLTQ